MRFLLVMALVATRTSLFADTVEERLAKVEAEVSQLKGTPAGSADAILPNVFVSIVRKCDFRSGYPDISGYFVKVLKKNYAFCKGDEGNPISTVYVLASGVPEGAKIVDVRTKDL